MLLMIDNYDSFTFNLVQYFGELGEAVHTVRNDQIDVVGMAALKPARIVFSPGPCTPAEAGVCVEAIRHFAGRVPMLGVCLGHQSIGAALGGTIVRAGVPMHGKTSTIEHDGAGVFKALPQDFTVVRYHSLVIERASLPADLLVTATSSDGEIMGVRHKTLPIEGVQFHPESILSAQLPRGLSGCRMKPIDLRSDTVTQPTAAMWDAMRAAPLGDDVFGDDPTVNALQQRIASDLGFEAALFMPTGTQSNLCALMSHCQRGDEYIVGQMAHTYRWEGGGAAVMGSIQPQPLPNQGDGTLLLSDIEAAIKPDDAHFARTRLLALENTWGGQVLPLPYIEASTALARRKGLARHLDGARLFNAAVASGVPAREITRHFDSVSVCFSKGLGTPAGSALCGTRDFIARAHRWRKMAGGGMRQAGVLAAAALYALDHHVARLADDHANARRLAEGLQGLPGVTVAVPQSNIVFVDLAADKSPDSVARLRERGVLATGLYKLRLVTHLDVTADDIERAVPVLRAVLG
jgi:threonine aldolase